MKTIKCSIHYTTHLHFDSCLETNTIRDGRLEVCYCVELFLNLRGNGWLGQVSTTRLRGFQIRRVKVSKTFRIERKSIQSL